MTPHRLIKVAVMLLAAVGSTGLYAMHASAWVPVAAHASGREDSRPVQNEPDGINYARNCTYRGGPKSQNWSCR